MKVRELIENLPEAGDDDLEYEVEVRDNYGTLLPIESVEYRHKEKKIVLTLD